MLISCECVVLKQKFVLTVFFVGINWKECDFFATLKSLGLKICD